MGNYTYLLILAFSILGPIALSFDKKVSFYKKWRYAFPAMIIPAVLYIIWDIWFTRQQVWSFNPAYITGVFVSDLPVEEVLFFFVIPYCCIFIYECVVCYFPGIRCTAGWDYLLGFVSLALIAAGLIFRSKMYTSTTFLFTALFISCLLCFRHYFRNFNTPVFLLSYIIILIPFLVVNGFLTSLPVVEYNNKENLGIRLYTIPVEDIVYGMLLVMMNVAIYTRLKMITSSRNT